VQDEFLYLPITWRPVVPYTGTVVSGTTPLKNIIVAMAYSTDYGSNWSYYGDTKTDSKGKFAFNNPPAVGSGAEFAVYYDNPSSTTSPYLWYFECTAVDSSSDPYSCTMNLKDILLKSPANGASVAPKVPFTWYKRTTTTDNYTWVFYDGSSGSSGSISGLGYISTVNITFCGFDTSYVYGWWMDAVTPYGFAVGFQTNAFKFKSMVGCSSGLGENTISKGQITQRGTPLYRWLLSQGVIKRPELK
jgi:hypothetical protein